MPRSRISPDLGRLPRVSGLKNAEVRAGNLRQVLRSLAIKNQREHPRTFYSLREVASRFKVPISTVAKLYREMEQEGLLSRVRSSKTILNGLRHNRRLSVRGFVGLPALYSNFTAIPEYRAFFTTIWPELWLRGFAATALFVRPDEIADGTLTEQLKSYEVDTVIWLQPGLVAKETLLRLSDMGIRVIGISEVGTPRMPARYYVWKEYAIEKLLREWKDRNLADQVLVVHSEDYRSAVTEEMVRLVLHNLQIEPVIRTFQNEDSSAFLSELRRVNASGIVFPAVGLVSMLGFRSPDQLAELLRVQRVAFLDGPIDFPFVQVPDVPVDLVTVNWQTASETIVSDLITREAFDLNRHTAFEAEGHSRVSIKDFCYEVSPYEIRPSRAMAAPTS